MSKIPSIKVKVENVDSFRFARDTNIQFQYVYDCYYKASYKKFDQGNCCVNNNLHQQMKLIKTNFSMLRLFISEYKFTVSNTS